MTNLEYCIYICNIICQVRNFSFHPMTNPTRYIIEAEWRIYTPVNQTTIGSDKGLSPARHQAIIWTNDGVLPIGPLGINFSKISMKIQKFLLKKMLLNVSSEICRPFVLASMCYGNGTNKHALTHWGWVTHICVCKLTIIDSDNGLSPGRRQAIIWINAGILFIKPRGTNFNEILIKIKQLKQFSFKKMRLKMSSGKRRPFCLGLNVLRHFGQIGRCPTTTIKHLRFWQDLNRKYKDYVYGRC